MLVHWQDSIGENMDDLVWRIYYADGSTYSNLDGAPEDAPGDGCLAIAQMDKTVGYRIEHNDGFYWWEKECWFCGDEYGLMQYQTDPGWKKVILGRAVLHDEWLAMWKRIKADFGPKSAYWPKERR
jgi:hypothetical protein